MKILFIGDIFGKSGRRAIQNELPKLIKNESIDFVIANAENTTHGRSLSVKHYQQLMNYGVNYFTFGNHTWHLKEIGQVLAHDNTIRPLNLKQDTQEVKIGKGSIVFIHKGKKVRITNLLGNTVECHKIQTNPFISFREFLESNDSDIHIIDFHAETTSEKNAFLLSFAGKVTAILGTHTHVQTADEKIYKNTAYITDVGMTGGTLGIIGAEPDSILDCFNEKAERFRLSPSNSKYQFNAVLLFIDEQANVVKSIKRFFINE